MDRCLFAVLLLLANLELSRGQVAGCFQGQWQCDDGLCIPDVLRCDGQGECLDGSDEMNCPGSTDCPWGQFACLDSVGCVDSSARCDGQIQCPTGSDEENCPAIDGCLDSEWMCQNRICIPEELRCNGQDDCMDNSDEGDCDACTESSVRCPGGTCFSAEKRCDGQFDCSDSSDEPLTCGRICAINNGGCSHVCTDEPWGTRCTCPVGFTLSPNGVVCDDLDECATPFPPCPHYCLNTPGSYYCHCRDGFKLWEGTTCLASGNGTRLLMVQKSAMGLLNVKSQQFDVIQTSLFDPVALALDVARGWYYWADRTGKIYKSDGQKSWTAYNGDPGIIGLACDWLNGNLFWTNHETKSIYMQAPDGRSYTIVLSKNISPSELALVPVESSMFWINAGPGDRETIEKSWMDGSERSSLTIITAQSAHSLTADVAAMRLYWISDFMKSVETVMMDGSGRYSFAGLFNGGPALSLAVFESVFYWVDDRGLWQVAQNQPNQKKLLLKTDLPLLAVYHELQQPQGSSACTKTNCLLCQLTKSNLDGYMCTCPNSKVLMADGSCEYPRFLYNTATTINLVEYRGREVIDTQLVTAKDGILSFDLDWERGWVYWANQTGHIQRTSLKPSNVEAVPAALPVCFITVDQKSGSLFWVSCDQHSIGTAVDKHPQRLYYTTRAIQCMHLDWMGRLMYWLEEDQILSMSMTGGKTNELLQLSGGFRESIAFDIRANSLLWNSKQAGLTKLSLLQEKSHKAGRRWNISGSVAAALEPYLLTVSDDVISLWDQRDGSLIQDMTVKDHVLNAIAQVGKLQTALSDPACNEPSVLCRHSSVCLSPPQLCDGKTDCPEGDDEEFCVGTCPSKEDFRCRDRRSCISRNLVCDGRSHCRDSSDEVDCSTIASLVTPANILKCRMGSKPCSDGRECVLYSHVCDGEEDCRDGSDELECDVPQATTTAAKPQNSEIDETPACISPSVKCPSADICITPQQFCNGKKDCPDDFDENNCLKKCPSKGDFLCKDRRSCISRSNVCDGRSNCYDGSDEAACSNVAAPPQTTLKCRLGSRLCRDGTECVLYSHVCDGERDCRDGSDELGCDPTESTNPIVENPRLNNLPAPIKAFTAPPTKPPCTSPSVMCPGSSVCLSPAQICDGKKDCPDGSDEKCLQRCLYRTDFLCKDRQKCISKSKVCDGRSDCIDGSDEVNCPSVDLPAPQKTVLKCPMGSRLCQDGTECVLYSHICDGDRDCRDGSDELECDSSASKKQITEPPTKPPCTSPSVLCPGSSVCLSPAQICDGKKDCPDGSDEKCLQRCPYRTDFLCKDRRKCISKSKVCDGRSDCIDGSDEVNCPSVDLPAPQKTVLKCPMGSRLCQDGTECVLYSHICDGDRDCRDGSDELECDSSASKKQITEPPTKPPCTSPSVLCPGSSVCLSPAQICDGKKDCPDGSDEKCLQRCPYRADFLCKDHRSCVSKSKVCDGRSDCYDGSDEFSCPSVTLSPPRKTSLKCRLGSRLCQDGTECVLSSHVCDGDRDCRDGSDELGCDVAAGATSVTVEKSPSSVSSDSSKPFTEPPTKPPCTSPSVLCPGSSVCLSPAQICDGKKDCPDGSDEKCLQRCPYRTDFLCKDRRKCISKSKVCDGRSDCIDGSDEVNCPSVDLPAPQKTVLKCRIGSKLCQDGTECVLFSHICDGDRDCRDGSDELECDSPASNKTFTEPPTKPPCISPSVLCPGSSVCLSPAQICDGKDDCPDGSDEKCLKRCPYRTDFLCKDRRSCVSRSQVCDGRSHCRDGSDEVGCSDVALPTPPKTTLKCRLGSRLCQDGSDCVLHSHVCDGDRDCRDGSDELGCDVDRSAASVEENSHLADSPSLNEPFTERPTKPPCTSPSALCPGSSVCLSPAQICDGKKDCPDGSDEKCVQRCPYWSDFRCKDRRSCVSKSQVCDGRSDCHDSSDEVNCPSVDLPTPKKATLKCRLGSRLCQDGTECVLDIHICDGDRDCRDGSDEMGCDVAESDTSVVGHPNLNSPLIAVTEPPTKPPCTSPSVLCPGFSVCLSPAQICDGKKDCPDGSDEECVQRCPYWTDFLCKDRRKCVSKSKVCDGRSDCIDGSDEVNCPSVDLPAPQKTVLKCRLGSKLCQDGTECVLYSHICDGDRDCRDGSDELQCDAPSNKTTESPTKPPCTSPSVLCPGSSVCLSPAQICDGKKDCPDGSDEKCLQSCPYWTDFLCKDRRSCVSRSQVCDGRSHCHDGSDEVGCSDVAHPTPPKTTLKCRLGSRLCQDGSECVLHSHVCDGDRDCRDGSDELGCDALERTTSTKSPVTRPPCSSPSVLCPGSSVCIMPAQFCDGQKDCPDGSDEDCVKKCADQTDFLCKDRRRCVSRSLVCDGHSHCLDGSDELNCPRRTTPAPRTRVLACRIGSKLCDDGTACVLYSHLCDGEDDCVDGSDERGCIKSCEQGEFQCAHGKMCIPGAQVCDGKSQCRDHSDEMNCWKPTKSCEHRCADGKRCLPKKLLCDGEKDCPDGSDELGCDAVIAATESSVLAPASVCVAPSVLCPGSTRCIRQQQLCDGQRDCPDGSDESGCVLKCENPNDFLCSDQRKCIRMKEVCDGQIHCPDGSDEKRCSPQKDPATSSNVPNTPSEPLKCRRGFKPCNDGLECVMYSHVCDGEKDCKDGSDEVGCAKKCKEGEFLCSHGSKCVPQSNVCDGQYDCQDRSDEMGCSTRSDGCHHHCDNRTRCIPDTFLCDGEKDCADGSDEEKCGSVTCLKGQYRCVSGQCVSEALRCDGYADCSDRSDEADCSRPPRCPAQLRCPHSHECLQKEWLCDGEEDCKDGSDETNCNTPPAKCRSYQWQCRDSTQCIPVLWRCDSMADCHNGMDEDGCTKKNCPSHLYHCVSGECIDPQLVCNGLSNCVDGSDEGVVCGQRNCSSPSAPRCDHLCISTPVGPTCFCTKGFRPQSNAQTCVDVDECNSEPHALCEHTCLNHRGSYTCHCHPGFYLEPDNKSCKTKDEPLLLASIQSELLLFGVHSGTLRIFSSVSQPVFSLDYHWAQQRVYWLSPDYQSIRFADMNNPNNKRTLIKGVKSDFLAVDWVGNNLYWVDGLVGQILAVKLSNTTLRSQDYAIVLGEDLEQPSSLVLLPHKGLMLWSEIGSKPQIEQSGMDGSRRKVVVSSDLSWPVSLAYDLLDNRMYWADEKLRCIGSASLDGDNIRIMQLAETPNPFSVVVFNDRVFWSDTKRRAVRSAKKNTGKDQKVLLKRPGQPFGLKLMHALSQPAVSQPCDQLSCSHLCLLAPAVSSPSELSAPIGVCRCPKGLLLSKDKITCSVPTDSSFVLFLSRNTIYQIHLRSMRRDGVSLKKMPNNRPLALPSSNEALGLDVSIRDLSLYVAYSGQGSVDVLRLSSSRSRQGLTRVEQILQLKKDDVVTALAVDWVTLNLYWSSNERPDIHVTSRQARTTSLLQGSLMGTTSIALHPPTGRLCYTAIVKVSGKAQTEVVCAWMDGRNEAVLWRKSTIPMSLVFSSQGKMIYWADTGESIIGSIGLDGTGYKQFTTGPGLLLSFTHTANIFLWVTLGKDVTRVWFTDGLQPKQLWFETKTSMVKIRAFSNDTQTGENSCSKNNGDCEHLCLPYPGGRTCKCGWGFLSVNITSCGSLPSCPAGEKSCFNGDKCISSSKFCDQHIDCPDQSDEQDCLSSNGASLGSKASGDQTPQSNAKNSILPVKKDSASCDLQHCSGHGRCITEGKVTRCQCLHGYKGESCQEANHGHGHVPVILGVFFLVVLVVAGIFIFSKRREWAALRQRSTDKENLMANMGLPSEDESSDSEELDSPVDTQPPSLPLVTVSEKADQHSLTNL